MKSASYYKDYVDLNNEIIYLRKDGEMIEVGTANEIIRANEMRRKPPYGTNKPPYGTNKSSYETNKSPYETNKSPYETIKIYDRNGNYLGRKDDLELFIKKPNVTETDLTRNTSKEPVIEEPGYLQIEKANLNYMIIKNLGRYVDKDNDIIYVEMEK